MDDKLNLPIREKNTVSVFQKLVEGKRERNVPFTGVVQKVRGSGINKTITVKTILEGVEVEKIFPIASPSITKIEIIEDKKTSKKGKKRSKSSK
jgi:large subunit ribosomal protein L19